MKSIINNIGILLLVVATGCHSSTGPESGNFSEDMEIIDMKTADFYDVMNSPPPPPPESAEIISQKLIKRGAIEFESEDISRDYNNLVSLLPNYQAYIENETQHKDSRRVSYELTIRVPSTGYDSLFQQVVTAVNNIKSKSSSIEDVTERYYDLKTRIKNKKALEERYIDLLKKTSAIKDILEIEKELNEIRTDIEQMEGQFRYLNKQVNFSTLHVSFYELLPYEYNASTRKGYGARLLTGLNDGWQSLLSFTVNLVAIWPFILMSLVVGWLLVVLRKFWVRNKKSKSSETK